MVRAELPQDRLVHLESKFQILERKTFVRRMRPAIGPGEPKEKRFHAENIAKLRNNRNAAAFANQRCFMVEGLLQSALRRFAELGMRISQIPGTAVPLVDFHRYSGRKMFFQMFSSLF